MSNHYYMTLAMKEAHLARVYGEVPVGAVLVHNDNIIAAGRNRREGKNSAIAHAEIEAISKGCAKLHSWRLENSTLFVTMEPCPMCTGAIINSRIRRVVFGVYDEKAGCLGSICDLSTMPFNHIPEVYGGIMENRCRKQIQGFFEDLRIINQGLKIKPHISFLSGNKSAKKIKFNAIMDGITFASLTLSPNGNLLLEKETGRNLSPSEVRLLLLAAQREAIRRKIKFLAAYAGNYLEEYIECGFERINSKEALVKMLL